MAETNTSLHPPIEPYRSHRIPVGDGHELHVEEVGNPQGQPVLFLHGGPGSGCAPWHRQFFDPQRFRAVLVDQRGAGRSSPLGELRANDTTALIGDLELIRHTLDIEQWLVFGGSWGSTLALAYAQAHAAAVQGLVLRGVFTATPEEFHWLMGGQAGWIQPEAWDSLCAAIPEDEHGDLTRAYYRRLTADDPHIRQAAAQAWDAWEGRIATLMPSYTDFANQTEQVQARARIECHYFVHQCFLDAPTQLLDRIDRIRHLPCVIVQGRYDVICPVHSAWRLHRLWPESELRIVTEAGHSAGDPALASALVQAINDLTDQLPTGG